MADTHTAMIDCGDGNTEAGNVNQGAGEVSGSHAYTAVGSYLVVITLSDDDGGEATQSFTVTVASNGYTGTSRWPFMTPRPQ